MKELIDVSDENTYTVYKHIFPNGKLYIGITSVDVKKRWKNGKGYQKHHSKVRNAIDKFGWDNILHEIIYEHLSKTEAEKLERELILKYNTIDDKYGYNIALGGYMCSNPDGRIAVVQFDLNFNYY